MAKLVLKDCFISVNSVDLSDHVSKVEVSLKKAAIDSTNFSGGGKEQVAGLKDDEFTVTFHQDFVPGEVDSILYPLYDDETEFPVEVRPTAAAVSATNPKYTGTCILLEYQPLTGKPGDLSEIQAKFPSQRSGIARATS